MTACLVGVRQYILAGATDSFANHPMADSISVAERALQVKMHLTFRPAPLPQADLPPT